MIGRRRAAAAMLREKILVYQDPERRASKRQKNLPDIRRLMEARLKLKKLFPAEIADKIKET